MKLLEDFPLEKYNDVQAGFDYCARSWVIPEMGNRKVCTGANRFHCFWKGSLNNRHILSLQSLIMHQSVESVTVWTDDVKALWDSPAYPKLKFSNRIVIKKFDKEIFDQMTNVKEETKDYLWKLYSSMVKTPSNINSSYNHNLAYASDIFQIRSS